MKTLKSFLFGLLTLAVTTTYAGEDPAPVRTLNQEQVLQVKKHVASLRAAGVTLEQLKSKLSSSPDPEYDCLVAAWDFGSMFETEYDQWAATDMFYTLCIEFNVFEEEC